MEIKIEKQLEVVRETTSPTTIKLYKTTTHGLIGTQVLADIVLTDSSAPLYTKKLQNKSATFAASTDLLVVECRITGTGTVKLAKGTNIIVGIGLY